MRGNGQRFVALTSNTIHPAVNFTTIMRPEQKTTVDVTSTYSKVRQKFPIALFLFLGKRASGSFHFNSRNVKKNRLIARDVDSTIVRADESSRKCVSHAYDFSVLPPAFTSRFSARLFSHGVIFRDFYESLSRQSSSLDVLCARLLQSAVKNTEQLTTSQEPEGTEIKAAIAEMSWRRIRARNANSERAKRANINANVDKMRSIFLIFLMTLNRAMKL